MIASADRSSSQLRIVTASFLSVFAFLLSAAVPARAQGVTATADFAAGSGTINQTAQTILHDPAQASLADPSAFRSNFASAPPKSASAFATTAVGTTAAGTITFTSTFTVATTVYGSGVYTQGAPNLDFKDVGTGTCDTNGYPFSYAANASCTTVVSFTPSKAGNRLGAEILYTAADGSAYYYGFLNGIGTGPQVTTTASTPSVTSLITGLSPYNSAVDGSGDLWVSDSVAKTVKEFVPSSGVYSSTPTNTFTGFTTPQGIFIDGTGNVYVGDSGAGTIWRLSATYGVVPSGTAPVGYVTFLTASTAYSSTVGVDPTQTYLWFTGLYSGSDYLIRCTISSGSCALGTTFTAAQSLAFDAAGYKYIVDSSAKTVIRMPVGTSVTKTTLISGLTLPYGIATDAAGDLYVTDAATGAGTGTLTEYIATAGLVPASTPTSTNTRSLATGLSNPYGVTLNYLGNVFISDNANTAVKFIDNTDPITLTFPSTAYNTTSGLKTATFQNIGNAALTFPVPAAGTTNPALTAGYTLDASSTCPNLTSSSTAGTLAAGATCTEAVKFTPTAGGTTTGTDVTTDNSLNVTSTQTINLSGTSPAQNTQTVVTVNPNTSSVGGNPTYFTATVTDTINTGIIPVGTVTFGDTVNGNTVNYGPYTIDNSGTYQIGTRPAIAGNHTISAVFTATDATAFVTSNGSQALTVAKAALGQSSVNFTVAAGSTIPIFAFFTYPGSIPPTGAVTFVVTDAGTNLVGPTCVYKSQHSNCQATFMAPVSIQPGNYTFNYSQAGDSNYTGTSGSSTVTITGTPHAKSPPARPSTRPVPARALHLNP